MAGIRIDSGALKMLRDINVKHQPSRDKVMTGWITALRDGREGLSAIGPILREIEQYRMWELDYGDPRRLLEVIGVYKLADTLDGVPQLLNEYVSRLVEGKPAGDVSARVQAQCQAAREKPVGKRGNPSGNNQYTPDEEKGKGDNVTFPQQERGNGKTYTLRRLARDRPDLLDRIESGELSANAAAIEAGFRKPPQPPLHKMQEQERLQVLHRSLTEMKDWAGHLVALLSYNELVLLVEAAEQQLQQAGPDQERHHDE
jgi:hypothetical protein